MHVVYGQQNNNMSTPGQSGKGCSVHWLSMFNTCFSKDKDKLLLIEFVLCSMMMCSIKDFRISNWFKQKASIVNVCFLLDDSGTLEDQGIVREMTI